eukprot:TRINITY_DN59923_c0_g1_i1.p1 TRINITY_DN59923_c0_g1~~TRINITY_DN59923_c0_g1_i1.p1  ORF type:complete len:326 (+),score=91.13 TRINITY_DN59923_c0_g1_i1:80-979(+)
MAWQQPAGGPQPGGGDAMTWQPAGGPQPGGGDAMTWQPPAGGPQPEVGALVPHQGGVVSRPPAFNDGFALQGLREDDRSICRHWRNGRCKGGQKGGNCRFQHPPDVGGPTPEEAQAAIAQTLQRQQEAMMRQHKKDRERALGGVCRHFLAGRCNFDNCRFSHDTSALPADAPPQQQPAFAAVGGKRPAPAAGGGGWPAPVAKMPRPQAPLNQAAVVPAQEGIWEEHVSDAGEPYWYNKLTGLSTWERPPGLRPAQPVRPPLPPGPPPQRQPTWEEYTDDYGRPYWYNPATGESVWEPPA